jgi:hypothetical protein
MPVKVQSLDDVTPRFRLDRREVRRREVSIGPVVPRRDGVQEPLVGVDHVRVN